MSIIEELYYGNINPNEKHHIKSSQYKNAMRVFCENEEKLMESLDGKQLKLFCDLVNASDEISAVSNIENFKNGFRLGVQMICDCLILE